MFQVMTPWYGCPPPTLNWTAFFPTWTLGLMGVSWFTITQNPHLLFNFHLILQSIEFFVCKYPSVSSPVSAARASPVLFPETLQHPVEPRRQNIFLSFFFFLLREGWWLSALPAARLCCLSPKNAPYRKLSLTAVKAPLLFLVLLLASFAPPDTGLTPATMLTLLNHIHCYSCCRCSGACIQKVWRQSFVFLFRVFFWRKSVFKYCRETADSGEERWKQWHFMSCQQW